MARRDAAVSLREAEFRTPPKISIVTSPKPHLAVADHVVAGDGYKLAARFFAPAAPPARAVLIVPAMGVTQDYYRPFAEFLSGAGYAAATFDYRGMGLSRPERLRGLTADIATWAQLDCAALLEALAKRWPAAPLVWLGHSLGGQIVPLVPNHTRLAKIVTVAAGSGYWRENVARLRRRSWLLWFVAAPVATALCGYFPGRRLGMVGDLPRNVMRQWRRWCLDPDYAAGAEGPALRQAYAAVRTPITSLSFADDEFMSARNIEALHETYSAAARKMVRLAPGDIGEKRIGHFGAFRPNVEDSLWRRHLLPELA
jgi:predicted alpha/beta hydrolase